MAFHAVRNLARLGLGVVDYNWMELGFGKTSSTSTAQATPRNLLGFKDGTRNIKAQQTDLLDDYVWVGKGSDQAWMRGGSYLISRRIQIYIENWDRDYLEDQQNVIGRAKVTGAPLSGGEEFTTPHFTQKNDQGQLVIPANAHIRLASHEENHGTRLLRRGYSFTDGIDPVRGTCSAGCSSSPSPRTRTSSSSCRPSSGPTTPSTNTSSTSGAASSPCRAGCSAAGTGATASSPEPDGPAPSHAPSCQRVIPDHDAIITIMVLETPVAGATAPGELSRRRRIGVLAICCMSLLIVGIDVTIVNVALPSIGKDFHASLSGLQWTVDAYTLVLASLLMISGSTADRFGRRRTFVIGLCTFAGGSLLCSLAPNLGTLIVFRMVQAVGGSMLNPVAMSIITNTFTDSPRAGPGRRHLGRGGGRLHGPGTGGRRRARDDSRMAVDLLHQHPDRAGGGRPGAAIHPRVQGGSGEKRSTSRGSCS